MYEIYLHENVKTTPFYKLVLDLLTRSETLHIAEQRLLSGFLRSVPKMSKQTPTEFIAEAEKSGGGKFQQDLDPYRKAHIENMPQTASLDNSGIISTLSDDNKQPDSNSKMIGLDAEEGLLNTVLPVMLRPVSNNDESYIIDDVLVFIIGRFNGCLLRLVQR